MTPQDFMVGGSADASRIAEFGWTVLGVFCVAAVVMWGLLAWVALRRRGSFDEHAHVAATGGERWVWIGGLGIPGLVLLVLFGLMLGVMSASSAPHAHASSASHASDPAAATGVADIRVTGQQWWFDAEYTGAGAPTGNVHVPTELHVPVGRTVQIELVTRDVIHSFWVPRLQGKVDLVPGHLNRIALRADRAGVFEGQCAEFCGTEHAKMRLLVVAEPEAQYRAWLQRQRSPAEPMSAGTIAERGQQIFLQAACPACHTVRGTSALGQVGPDLTHVGSRRRIAGGSLENDAANLSAWVTDAQSLKPGSRMPTLRELRGDELRALTAYLGSLQ